jgi:hypothetical protein
MQNCWQYMKCGREPGGARTHDLGVCPAATNRIFHGFSHGKFAGRACWFVAGTFCEGEAQGTFTEKFNDCIDCGFYKSVKAENQSSEAAT